MDAQAQLLWEFQEAALRLAHLGALEGAAGNISTFLPADAGTDLDLAALGLDERLAWEPPHGATLPPGLLLITGTGRRLRDVGHLPAAVLCAVEAQGNNWWLHRAAQHTVRPTSEIDTHIGLHAALCSESPVVHSVVHAQPPSLTWLSHVAAYRDGPRLNRQLLRWQPETMVMLPEGLQIVPFITPGTPVQGRLTTEAATRSRVVIWAKHGVVAHAAGGPLAAVDLIDYVEAAARYEVCDIQGGRLADGLTLDELRSIALRFGVSADLLDRLPEDVF